MTAAAIIWIKLFTELYRYMYIIHLFMCILFIIYLIFIVYMYMRMFIYKNKGSINFWGHSRSIDHSLCKDWKHITMMTMMMLIMMYIYIFWDLLFDFICMDVYTHVYMYVYIDINTLFLPFSPCPIGESKRNPLMDDSCVLVKV